MYAALGDPYPLAEPMFLACGHYRPVGQESWIDTEDIRPHMLDPNDVDAALGLRDWEFRVCD